MRAMLIACLGAIAALGLGLLATTLRSIPEDAQAAATFLLRACGSSADNLDAVAHLANQRHWTSMIDPTIAENDPLKVIGMWRVNDGSRSYTVTTGVGPRNKTACQVTFEEPKPRRDDFLAAVSRAVTLKSIGDFPGSDWHYESYQIENLAPTSVVLGFVSSSDGAVYNATIHGP